MDTQSQARRWIAWAMLSVLVSSVLIWYFTLDTLPANLRFITGEKDGLYNRFGLRLESTYEAATGRRMTEINSAGTVQNANALRAGRADLAMIQGGAVSLDGLAILAPLYEEVVHVVARSDLDLRSLDQLAGRTVLLGSAESGMRASAVKMLEHFRLLDRIEEPDADYFMDILTNRSIDAVIVTTGILNPDLRQLLGTGEFTLIPVPDTRAVTLGDAFFKPFVIPRGLYGENPSLPADDITSIATTAFLAVRQGEDHRVADTILQMVYETGLWVDMPNLIPRAEADAWNQMPLHPAARQYFNPSDEIGRMANIMESLAAFKELLFALGAGLYLMWDRWRRQKEQEKEAEVRAGKEHLDSFMTRTLDIEERQMKCDNVEELKAMLDQVTAIKLEALRELTHEELRGDRVFQIFIIQCANLINKIQAKIAMAGAPAGQPRALGGLGNEVEETSV